MKGDRTFGRIKVIGLGFSGESGRDTKSPRIGERETERDRETEIEREREGEGRKEKDETEERDIGQRNTLTNSQSQLLQ